MKGDNNFLCMMGPVLVLLEIMIFITISNSMTLERGQQPPRIGGYNYFNRPSPPTDGYGLPNNWENTGSMNDNGYPLYCKRVQKNISIDEHIFPFSQCVFEDDDDSDDGYSQNYLGLSNPNINYENNPSIKTFNAPQNRGDRRQNFNYKNPSIANFNAPQNTGFPSLKKGNDVLGSANSGEKQGLPYELQRSSFKVLGESSQRRNEFTNLSPNSDAHLTRDRFGFANYDYFQDPSNNILTQTTPFHNSAEQSQPAVDQLKEQLISKENINNQLDRDKILSVLNAKSKTDSNQYRNLDYFYNPSQYAPSNKENVQNYLKFPFQPFSTNNNDDKNNSSTLINQQDLPSKSISKNEIAQEFHDSPSEYYHYLSSLQSVPNIRVNQLFPPIYNGLQSGPFNINGYRPFGINQDKSSNHDIRSTSMNNTSKN